MTVATTDGDTTWAFRYSSEGRSRSLFHSTDVSTLRAQYPDNPVLHGLSDDARLVVSEPLGDLRGAWREVPESTCLVVRRGPRGAEPVRALDDALRVLTLDTAMLGVPRTEPPTCACPARPSVVP